MDANVSNAHGQLLALTAAVRGLLDAQPALKTFVALRIEQAIAIYLNSAESYPEMLNGMEHVRDSLLNTRKP